MDSEAFMMRRVLASSLGLLCLLGMPASHAKVDQTAPKAVLVTGSKSVSAIEGTLKARLEKLGFDVATQPAAQLVEAGAAVVVVPSAASPKSLGKRLRAASVPVVTWQAELFPELGMTAEQRGLDFGVAPDQTTLALPTPSHTLAAGLWGRPIVSTGASAFTWALPGPDAIVIAALPDDANHAAAFAYEQGAAMPGLRAPARRVGFFAGEGLTRDGWRLFNAAVRWAATPNRPPVVEAGPDQEISLDGTAELAGAVADDGIPEPGTLSVRWEAVSGPGQVRFADDAAAPTTATFSSEGTYVLRLTADDGLRTASDEATVTVQAGPGGTSAAAIPTTPQPLTLTVPTGSAALMITATTVTAGDTALKNRLLAIGFTNPITMRTGATYAPTDLDGKSVVVITASADAATVAAQFRAVTQGVVTLKNTLFDDMALTGTTSGVDYGSTTASQFVIDTAATASSDPMVLGPATPPAPLNGTVAVLTAAYAVSWGTPGPWGVTLARTPGTTPHPTIFRYAPGAPLVGGSYPLHGRRVAFGLTDAAASKLNPNGGALFDDAVNWAAGFSNARPTVSAGADHVAAVWANQARTIPALTALDGAAYDDGLPNPPGALSLTWSVVDSPGCPASAVTIATSQVAQTTATFASSAAGGTCTFRLTASDGALSNSDDVQIQVYDRNTPPVVSAGSSQNKELGTGNTITLTGTAADDGLPLPPGAMTYLWSQVSGPGGVTFATPTALSTTATLPAPGTYMFQLTANDNELDGYGQTTVTATSTVVLVYKYESPSAPGDAAIEQRIEALGHTVLRVADSVATASSATNKALVVISSGCVNARIMTKFRAVTRPVLTMHLASLDDMGLTPTNTQGLTAAASQVAIFGDTSFHPITAGLRGTVTVADVPAQMTYGAPVNAQDKIASVAGQMVVFAYDKGETMPKPNASTPGLVAPARRVALGFWDATLASLTTDGETLVDAAVRWATSTSTPPMVNAGSDQIIDWAAPSVTTSLPSTVTDLTLPPDGNPPSIAWSKVSGPGTVAFATPNCPTPGNCTTDASFDAPGVYVLRATANDGQLSGSDDVTVTVNGAPVVDAGPNIAATVGIPVTLVGSGADDGQPNPTLSCPPVGAPPAPTCWSLLSGPPGGTVVLGSPDAFITTATFSGSGAYVLQFAAYDGASTGTDTTQVDVNGLPAVDAGPDVFATVGVAAPLNGSVTDDGLPLPPGVTVTWSKVSGPGAVTFENPNAPVTTATFSDPGSYVLALTANDGGGVPVTDTTPAYANAPPVVDAGPDVQVTYPSATASLAGTATDTTLPNPPGGLSYTWSKVSGPGTVSFSTPDALTTDVTFSATGIYILRLTASDGYLSASDDVAATVRVAAGTAALLVVGTGNNPADATLQARLQAVGYTVTAKTDATAVAGDADGQAVVLLSGTVDPAVLATAFRDVAVPVIVAQPYLFDDMQLTGSTPEMSYGLAATETQVRVTNSSHPMAAGLTGTVTVASTTASLGWGVPNANATAVVRPMTNGRSAVFGYDTGAAMVGRAAPARRVGLFLQADAVAGLTNAGWALFDAALHWAISRVAPPTFDPAPQTLTTVPTQVTLCCVTADTTIQYTLDGSDPTTNPNPATTPYTAPIDVSTTTTIKAVAIRNGFDVSVVAVGKYSVSLGKLASPTISPGSGVKDSTQFPTLVGPPGAEIWYTTDGAEPAPGRGSSTLYAGPMPVGSAATPSVTVKAKAFMTDWTPSDPASALYDFDPDRDGLSTMRELDPALGTNPLNSDTNGDGIDDGTEVAMGLSPTNLDMDGDSVPNATEITQGTDPFKADTDGDGVSDGQDCLPLDSTRSACSGDPNDTTPPTITLIEPPGLTPPSVVPPLQ